MEEPMVSRFNSQSTSRTLVDSDYGTSSPLFSPLEKHGQLPIVQTPDSKQWIDLYYLSPKILKELRQQYDPSIKDEPNALAKGAAKVKAWARQSKLGIDIRLRRKLNQDQDEVTDIRLVPNFVPSYDFASQLPVDKATLFAELPEASSILAELPDTIMEMPDTSIRSELSITTAPSRSSMGSSVGEQLPRYEPRRGEPTVELALDRRVARAESLDRLTRLSDDHALSEGSVDATQLTDASLSNTRSSSPDIEHSPSKTDAEAKQDGEHVSIKDSRSDASKLEPKENIEERNENDDNNVFQELQEIIKSLREQQASSQATLATPRTFDDQHAQDSRTEGLFRKLKLANKSTYETETDVEPPSPSVMRGSEPRRRKSLPISKRKTSLPASRTPSKFAAFRGEDRGSDHDPLLRQPTLPKRVSTNAGTEAVWRSVIRMQEKILGPEHPLTYKAKADLAHSKFHGHAADSIDINSLYKSQQLATQILGSVHPWVAAFSEDLTKLEELVSKSSRATTSDKPGSERRSTSDSPLEGTAVAQTSSSGALEKEQALNKQNAASSSQYPVTTLSDGRTTLPRIATNLQNVDEPSSARAIDSKKQSDLNMMWSTTRPPHVPRSALTILSSLMVNAFFKIALNGITWTQRNYGPEQSVEPGKVRVRWTCSCGAQLHDDFVERRHGAARELESYLNRTRTATAGNGDPISPVSPSSSAENRSFANSSWGGPPSSQTSWSSHHFPNFGYSSFNGSDKPSLATTCTTIYPGYSPMPEPPWLLTCANEDRYTPKLAHLDMAPYRIRSDKDLALSLREHYFNLNKKWWRALRLRGLATIEFVQFEVHSNRFADIRKCPDMPPISTGDYNFEPADLLPPVGSTYLLHLFKHPEDYDGELITYLRAPKKNGRLQLGVGYGIHLVEGFLADKVWMIVSAFFALGSIVFAAVWASKKHDLQGASGIAAWMVALAVLIVGWLQALLG